MYTTLPISLLVNKFYSDFILHILYVVNSYKYRLKRKKKRLKRPCKTAYHISNGRKTFVFCSVFHQGVACRGGRFSIWLGSAGGPPGMARSHPTVSECWGSPLVLHTAESRQVVQPLGHSQEGELVAFGICWDVYLFIYIYSVAFIFVPLLFLCLLFFLPPHFSFFMFLLFLGTIIVVYLMWTVLSLLSNSS